MSTFARAILLSFAAVSDWTAYGLQLQLWNSSLDGDSGYISHGAKVESSMTDRPAERKPVIWIHLHKTAGTMMCKFAKINDEVVVEPEGNCNFWLDGGLAVDGFAAMGLQKHRMSCAQRSELYRRNGFTWGQIEREVNLEDIGCNDSFMYGIMLREPMGLMLSSLNYDHWNATNLVTWLQDTEVNIEHACGDCCNHTGLRNPAWQMFDNFAVRTLNGYDAWMKPPGHVTEKDLEQAKQHLAAMDVVMVLEDLEQDKVQMEKFMGWKNTEFDEENVTPHSKHFTGDQHTFLKQLNKYDDALYTYARDIARQRRESLA